MQHIKFKIAFPLAKQTKKRRQNKNNIEDAKHGSAKKLRHRI